MEHLAKFKWGRVEIIEPIPTPVVHEVNKEVESHTLVLSA